MVCRTRSALAALLCLLAALLGACGSGAPGASAPLTAADVVRAWRAAGLVASDPAMAPASGEGAYVRGAPTAGCTIWVVLRPADTPGAGAWGYVADCRTPAARDLSWPCAPFHPVIDPPRSGEKFGGTRLLGHPPDLAAKAKGESSMVGKRERPEGA